MIYKISSFVNESGSKIEELVPIESGDSDDGVAQFVGVAQLVSEYASTEVRFPIEKAKSLDEAFGMFSEELDEFMAQMRKQMEEQANKPELIVPDSITQDVISQDMI
tara:strand:- start:372 stop:692 length:321 start_codon:yes stop_codon:yes gene_type:complete